MKVIRRRSLSDSEIIRFSETIHIWHNSLCFFKIYTVSLFYLYERTFFLKGPSFPLRICFERKEPALNDHWKTLLCLRLGQVFPVRL